MHFFNRTVEQFLRAKKRLKRWQKAVSVMAAVVVFVTTYALILPAITLDKDTASGQSGIEIATSDDGPESGGTVYEAEPEEEQAEEPQKEEAVTEDIGSGSESQDAEMSEADNADENPATDHGQNTEEQTGSREAEDASDDADAAPDAAKDDAVTAPAAETPAEGETLEEIRQFMRTTMRKR